MLMHRSQALTSDEEEISWLFENDLEFYCANNIKIIPKGGGFIDFDFNDAQDYLHYQVQKMLREHGWVRIIVVKGRQQGISTYITARFLHAAIYNTAVTISILAHDADSTIALFEKAQDMGEKLPIQMRPKVLVENRKELSFDNDSKYMVSTAGSKQAGRGRTAQRQHKSEVGFFENPEEVDKGVGQIVADYQIKSEVFEESTGNGRNHFYFQVLKYLESGDYQVVFIPWYWQQEYRSLKLPEGFKATPEEEELRHRYGTYWCRLTKQILNRPWDDYQLEWRRQKILKLGERGFKQEYPNFLMEAFQASGSQFFDSELVEAARRTKLEPDHAPLVLGVDPARKGDRTVICLRQGRRVIKLWKYNEMESMQLSGIVSNIIDEYNVDKCFIDNGMGYGTIDRLVERGYTMVEGVNFGGASSREDCANKRAEMAYEMRDWMEDGPTELPDDEDMAADIGMMPDSKARSSGKMIFPDKAKMKEDFNRSPDILDAMMLTFAFPVKPKTVLESTHTENTRNGSQLATLRRLRAVNKDPQRKGIRRRAAA